MAERPNHPKEWNTRRAGKIAGGICGADKIRAGYRIIRIDDVPYLASRLAWLVCTGEWPAAEIDHINRNRSDDRISNLRPAARFENVANGGPQKNNRSSGMRGVSFHKGANKWRATLTVRGKYHWLGLFDAAAEAAEVRDTAAKRLLGEFATIVGAPVTRYTRT